MADFRTDLDKLIGSEPEDYHVKAEHGSYKDRASDMSDNEKLSVKELPFKETQKSFVIRGG